MLFRSSMCFVCLHRRRGKELKDLENDDAYALLKDQNSRERSFPFEKMKSQ